MLPKTFYALVATLTLATTVSANLSTGVGAVGQGRSLFTPTCGFACLDSFWSLRLPCSKPDANTTLSINSPACHASSRMYLESLAWCLQQHCPGEGLTDAQIEKFWDRHAGDGLQVNSWRSHLITKPTETLGYAETILNAPSLVNSTVYDESRQTILSYADQEKYHALWSTIIVVVSVGIALLIGSIHWLDTLVLRITHRAIHAPVFLKKDLLNPAFIGKRNLQLQPWKMGYVPQRSVTILIIIFVAVNVILNFVNVPSFHNDTWFISSSTLSISNLANRLGSLAVANLALAVMLSGRNSIVLSLTGCSRTTILAFHRWAGRVAVVKGVAHGAIYLSTSDRYGMKVFTPAGALHYIGCNASYWELGIGTLAIFAAILFFSLAPFRVHWYETFLISHVVLGIAGLVTLWYHLSYRFHGQYGYEVWLYIAFAFWIFDRVFRVLRLLALNYGWFTGRTPPAKIELLSDGQLMKITAYTTLFPNSIPGQYSFVYFPTLTWFFESHPFSVISWGRDDVPATSASNSTGDAENAAACQTLALQFDASQAVTEKPIIQPDAASSLPTISVIIRPCNGITKRLHQRLTRSGCPISLPVLIEGPYETPTRKNFTSETILAFAGGIGITGILARLKHYIASTELAKRLPDEGKITSFPHRFVLFWMVRSAAEVEALMPLFPSEAVMRSAGVELHVVCKEEGDRRVDFGTEIAKEKRLLSKKMALGVLVCGPAQMADEIRRQVVKAEGIEGGNLDLSIEAFAW